MVNSKDIGLVQGGKNAEEISSTVEKFKDVNITYQNSAEIVGKVKSRVEIIESQINNLHTQLEREKQKLANSRERIGKDRLNTLKAQNIVPLELFESLNQITWYLQEMLAWKLIEFELVYPIMDKQGNALTMMGAFEIESQVLAGIRENQTRLLDHAKEMMVGKMGQQDQKIEMLKDTINERAQVLLDKQLLQFRDLQRAQQEADEKKWQLIIDFIEKYSEAANVPRESVTGLRKTMESIDRSAQRDFTAAQKEIKLPEPTITKMYDAVPEVAVAEKKKPVYEDKLLQCPKCTNRYKDELQLGTHMEMEHGDEEYGLD